MQIDDDGAPLDGTLDAFAFSPCADDAETALLGRERTIDLFSGSGAVTAALRRGGFRVIAAVDHDPVVCRTYRLNHPGVDLVERNIRKVDPRTILRRHPEATGLDLLVVCAPCQPFSSQNRKRENDERAKLLLEAGKFARVFEPKCILFENVPGLVSTANASILTQLEKRLASLGYLLGRPRKIDAADLGVPQRRVRCVMIASKNPEALRAFEASEPRIPRRTVRDAIGNLPQLRSGERDPIDELHFARVHKPIALSRLAVIPRDGGSRGDLPPHLELACHRGRKGFPDVYGRMKWDDVAPTLTTGCNDVTRGRFAHPEQDRAITLREAALLQTFPMDYRFVGNCKQRAAQIGNAVPVAMVEALLPVLRAVIGLANSCWSAPRSLVHPKWETHRGIERRSDHQSFLPRAIPCRSHTSLNSRGVAYPNELCGRIALYSRRYHFAFSRASSTDSNSSRSRNSSRNRL